MEAIAGVVGDVVVVDDAVSGVVVAVTDVAHYDIDFGCASRKEAEASGHKMVTVELSAALALYVGILYSW